MTDHELTDLFEKTEIYSVPMILVKNGEVLYRNSAALDTRSLCRARPFEALPRAQKKLLCNLEDGAACVLRFNSRSLYPSTLVLRNDDVYVFVYLTMLDSLPVLPCNFLEEENLGCAKALCKAVLADGDVSKICADLALFTVGESEISAKMFFRFSELMLKYMFSEDVAEGVIDTDDGFDTAGAFSALGKIAQTISEDPPSELDDPIVLEEYRDGVFSIYLRGISVYETEICSVLALKPYSFFYQEGVGAFALALACAVAVSRKSK